MNKTDLIIKISEMSKVDTFDCEKVLVALEQVLSDELAASRGASNAFDKIYTIMGFFKKNK